MHSALSQIAKLTTMKGLPCGIAASLVELDALPTILGVLDGWSKGYMHLGAISSFHSAASVVAAAAMLRCCARLSQWDRVAMHKAMPNIILGLHSANQEYRQGRHLFFKRMDMPAYESEGSDSESDKV